MKKLSVFLAVFFLASLACFELGHFIAWASKSPVQWAITGAVVIGLFFVVRKKWRKAWKWYCDECFRVGTLD